MSKYYTLILLTFLITLKQAQSSSLWDPTIQEGNIFHWKAEVSELGTSGGDEQYNDKKLIGGISMEGGDIKVRAEQTPLETINFFSDDLHRIDISIAIEGDMGILDFDYNSDFPLLILPILHNNNDFFPELFNNKLLLENLTKSTLVKTDILNDTAIAEMKYEERLDIKYVWNTTTGLMESKLVTAPSGSKMLVNQGKGIEFGIEDQSHASVTSGVSYLFNYFFLPILLIILKRIAYVQYNKFYH